MVLVYITEFIPLCTDAQVYPAAPVCSHPGYRDVTRARTADTAERETTRALLILFLRLCLQFGSVQVQTVSMHYSETVRQ